jgi:histidinol-phosphate/aromatic aminotransferase/cobyric acid decarboxylase-like protein
VGQDAAGLAEKLRNLGIAVRPLELWGAPECIRVSIGTPQQTDQLLQTLQQSRGKIRGVQAGG